MPKKILIIGGVAGGASAAARLRRLDENAEIIMFEKGDYISFANCGLPYFIGGVIAERKKLLVQTVEEMMERFNIDIRVRSEVKKIFREKKEIEVTSSGRTYRESYDYLVLSPGADPIAPPIPGVERENIFTIRNMSDMDRIKNYILTNKPRKAAVVGGGYIGVEMAENLSQLGIQVKVIEGGDQIMAPFDLEMARMIEKTLIDKGIEVVLDSAVEKFDGHSTIDVFLKNGKHFNVDFILLSVGIRPKVQLASEAGLEIGEKGGIRVDRYLRTSDPYIYAIGDAIEVQDIVNGGFTLIPLAGPGNKQGRIAADNICERKTTFKGSQGTSIIKVFDSTAAATGNNEKTLLKMGIPYIKSYTHSGSHAGYYPGARMMTIKLIFSPEGGRILGAQIVGKKGVDKRIDILATAIRHGFTVFDLEELELAYAPPFSSAKDAINMAGFVAANILKGDMQVIYWDDLEGLNPENIIILDVRTEIEYKTGHIKGSVNIPVDRLRERIVQLPRNKKIVIYCKIGLRGYFAYRILVQKGFDACNISGGYELYLAERHKYGEGIDLNEHMTRFENN